MSLEKCLEAIRKDAEIKTEELEKSFIRAIDEVRKEMDHNIDVTLDGYNKKRCQRCQGTGALERIDASYMRRFGLRDWDGCEECGGNGNDIKGRGFVD